MIHNVKLIEKLLGQLDTKRKADERAATRQLDDLIYPRYLCGGSATKIITVEHAARLGEEYFAKLRGTSITDLLVDTAVNGDTKARSYAIGALTSIGGDRSKDVLLCLLNDPNAAIRNRAASCCYRFSGDDIVGKLIHLLNDTDDGVVQSAVRTLGYLRVTAAVSDLMRLARNKVWEIRSVAISSLGNLADPGALQVVRDALTDKHSAVRKSAKGALAQYDLKRRKEAWQQHAAEWNNAD